MERKQDIILRVRDLRISFRTVSGKVQAVRDVSFDLERGKTLAIVGESGSGKSVTTRATLGILAKNAIVESGEILYDGKDILRLSEWELHKIRGEKISMIFQDPLSSLNPIVRIGRQLTEASVLKARSARKENKKLFDDSLKAIEENLPLEEKKNAKPLLDQYKKEATHYAKEYLPYSYSVNFLKYAKKDLEDILFAIDKKTGADLTLTLYEVVSLLRKSFNAHTLTKKKEVNHLLFGFVKKLIPLRLQSRFKKINEETFIPFKEEAEKLLAIVNESLAKEEPDFFGNAVLGNDSSKKEDALKAKEEFLKELSPIFDKALQESSKKALENTRIALSALKEALPIFEKEDPSEKELLKSWKELKTKVKATINPLDQIKDSYSYTFEDSLKKAITLFFETQKTNAKEEKRYAKEKEKWDALKAKGHEPSFKVVPANIVPKERLRKNMTSVITNLISVYSSRVESGEKANELIERLNKLSVLSKKKHTNFMAKMVAIDLMNEVGIPEPRKRFRQYPFEFSGGMRQRIVIAIALTSNPEVLICDEPTTALDVTIQAQILELINRIKKERHLSVIFITHNLGVVANMADKIAVMYAGKIVEYGTSNDIFYDPKHPYTWALLSSMPDLETKEKLDAIPGTPPNMIYPPVGDAYAARNKYALKIDFRKEPPLYMVGPTHFARTWLLAKEAPVVYPPEIVVKRIQRMEERYSKDIDKEMALELEEPIDEAYKAISIPADPEKAKRLNPFNINN